MPPTSPVVAAWELGNRLRDAREEIGMRGIAAAKRLGLSPNFLSDVEHGKRRLTVTMPLKESITRIRNAIKELT